MASVDCFRIPMSRPLPRREDRACPAPPAATSCRSPARPTSPTRCCARSSAPTIDHRGPEFAELGREVLDGARTGLRHHRAGRGLPGLRAPAPGRRRWSTRCPPATPCWPSRPATSRCCGRRWPPRSASRSQLVPGDWRHGVDPAVVGRAARRRHRPRDQGRLRGAQRDLDRRDQPGGRGARGDRRGRPPRAAARRHDLLARLDRLPPRRVGRRRHRRPARRRG